MNGPCHHSEWCCSCRCTTSSSCVPSRVRALGVAIIDNLFCYPPLLCRISRDGMNVTDVTSHDHLSTAVVTFNPHLRLRLFFYSTHTHTLIRIHLVNHNPYNLERHFSSNTLATLQTGGLVKDLGFGPDGVLHNHATSPCIGRHREEPGNGHRSASRETGRGNTLVDQVLIAHSRGTCLVLALRGKTYKGLVDLSLIAHIRGTCWSGVGSVLGRGLGGYLSVIPRVRLN